MNLSSLINQRLGNQQLAGSAHKTVTELVQYMGAMQAQDFSMSKWAVGIRANALQTEFDTAFNRGDILRMHVLRPTWHLVAEEDAYWLLQLSASSIKTIMKSREKQLDITGGLYRKTNSIIEKAVQKKHCTAKELTDELRREKIDVTSNRSAHFLMQAELDGLICSGELKDGNFTYAPQNERIKTKANYSRSEALHHLANRYFRSHGPAKLSDFAWWAGLTGKEANEAANSLDRGFTRETYKEEIYLFWGEAAQPETKSRSLLLPAYDEYIISYKDRKELFGKEVVPRVISTNGIFWPALLVNGKIAGKWSRKVVKDTVVIEVNLFHPLSATAEKQIRQSAVAYANFINKIPVIIQPI